MLTIPPEVIQINELLKSHFGVTDGNEAIWRVVWSDDQFEKRLMDVTDEGLSLLHPEVREVPKYRQWITHKWVLEQLVVIPEVNIKELAGKKLSYEPIFVFENAAGEALPPKFEVAKFVIDTIHAALGKTSLAKYKDPESTQEGALQAQKERVDKIVEEIFGDESTVTDHLSRQTGVVIAKDDYLVH